jgi:hypothetical protein
MHYGDWIDDRDSIPRTDGDFYFKIPRPDRV